MRQYVTHYSSPLGTITLASDGDAVIGLWFDGQRHFGSTLEAGWREDDCLPVFHDAKQWLDCYFEGHNPGSIPPVCLLGTSFRLSVWKHLCEIPYGCVRTYGEMARELASSARAVGGAVGHNPVSLLVPCHRVMGTGGKLVGYAGGGWRKRWLLEWERLHCDTMYSQQEKF